MHHLNWDSDHDRGRILDFEGPVPNVGDVVRLGVNEGCEVRTGTRLEVTELDPWIEDGEMVVYVYVKAVV